MASKVELVVQLVDEVYRTRGRIIAASQLNAGADAPPVAQTAMLASVVHARQPPTVSRIARSLGMSRQAVQQQVDRLVTMGLVTTCDNPDHRRARLLVATPAGREVLTTLDATTARWAARITKDLRRDDLATLVDALRDFRHRIETDAAARVD